VIPNSHVSCAEFKDAINTALEQKAEGSHYDEVKVLLLNWEANDLALKKPGPGSPIIDETLKLMGGFQDFYHYNTEYYSIPSDSPQVRLMGRLSRIMNDLTDKVKEKKKVLFILYYHGHGCMMDGKLIWSA
jgi:hypothetical protein